MTGMTFDEISIGDTATYTREVTQGDIADFARVTGDNNPVHLSEEFAKSTQFGSIIAHGMLTASYISTVLGTEYPGQGSIFVGLNNLSFKSPVRPGDIVTATVTVTKKHATKPIVTFACECTNQDGKTIMTAEAVVMAPVKKVENTPQP